MPVLYADRKQYRFRNAWRQLTAVRIVLFVTRLIGRFLGLIFELFLRSLRFIGLGLIEGIYALKLKFVDWKYSGRREGLSFIAFWELIFSWLWLLPRGVGLIFKAFFSVFKEAGQRSQAGLKEEMARNFTRVPRSARSLAWSMINFILTIAVVMLPVLGYAQWRKIESAQGSIFSSVRAAVEDLFSAKDLLEARNVVEARKAFGQASGNFLKAREDLASINGVLLTIAGAVPAQKFQLAASARHLAAAGQLSSQLGEELTGAITLPPGTTPSVANFLDNFVAHAQQAQPIALSLQKELAAVNAEALPEEYRGQFSGLTEKAEFLSKSLAESVEVAEQLQKFLGEDMDRRYLLVFQNNAEKRGPGGFIGSYALVDFHKGEIRGLEVPKGGTYDTEAGLSRLVAAPQPLALLNPLWHFWDANWWPDWPMSARKLMWFYEKSNGPTVDGVISLTPTVIEKLLAAIGPIDMTKDYGVVINADNFWEVTQTFAEQKPNVTREPKKIIGDLVNEIIKETPKRLSPETAVKLIGVLEDSFAEKQALLYFTDSDLQASVSRFGWGGEMLPTDGDYLMVTNTNIGGQKTDRAIRESIDQSVQILPDGSIIDNLTIRREHTASKGQPFIGVRNVDWVRIYVPEGSELISADGFYAPDSKLFDEPDLAWERDPDLQAESAARTEVVSGTKIYSEKGKTVFANWSMIDPGETAILHISYRLPFKVGVAAPPTDWRGRLKKFIHPDSPLAYSLLVQKQPGAATEHYSTRIDVPDSLKTVWTYPEALTADTADWSLTQDLNSDLFTALLFTPSYEKK